MPAEITGPAARHCVEGENCADSQEANRVDVSVIEKASGDKGHQVDGVDHRPFDEQTSITEDAHWVYL